MGRANEFEKYAGRTFAIRSLAVVGATLLGGPIASATDLRVPILLGAAASVLAAAVAFTLREPPRDAPADAAADAAAAKSYRETTRNAEN